MHVVDGPPRARSESESKEPVPIESLVEIRWRVRRPSENVIACGIFDHAGGVELRAFFGDGEVVRSRLVTQITEARLLAGEWLDAMIEQGGFELVSATPEI